MSLQRANKFKGHANQYEKNAAVWFASPYTNEAERNARDRGAMKLQDRADRYNRAAKYLEKKAYGEGHDMTAHGEGKPHGQK